MNKLVHHGIQLQIQMDSHEVYIKSKIETYMIWGNIILDLEKPITISGPIEVEFSGTCLTLWPQGVGRRGDLTHNRQLHSVQLSVLPPASQSKLEAGRYHLPFEFPIPNTLPPTVELNNGTIAYKITAKLRRTGALFNSITTSVPIFLIRYPELSPLDMRYVSAHRKIEGVECDFAFDCPAAILGDHLGIDLNITAQDPQRPIKIKSVLFHVTETRLVRVQEEGVQQTDHSIAVLKWAYHHVNADKPFTEDQYMNLKDLDWDLSTPLQGRFVFPVPTCQFVLKPTVKSRDIVITHWAKLTVKVEKDGVMHEALLESPFEILCCRLAPILTESPPQYEECAKAEVAVSYEYNAHACPCMRKDNDQSKRGKTTIMRLLPRYQFSEATLYR
ncbi:unnamed protein product [Umbelopsis ramanniana]